MLTKIINYLKSLFSMRIDRSYEEWTEEEHKELISYVKEGLCDEQISYILGRSESAIYQKRMKLRRKGKL